MAIVSHIDSKFFGRCITAAVVLNTAVTAWGMLDPGHMELTEHVETGFLVLFGGELVLRARSDWRSPWFAFDAVVIVLALLPVLPLPATVLRVARIGRIARMVHLGRHQLHHLSALRGPSRRHPRYRSGTRGGGGIWRPDAARPLTVVQRFGDPSILQFVKRCEERARYRARRRLAPVPAAVTSCRMQDMAVTAIFIGETAASGWKLVESSANTTKSLSRTESDRGQPQHRRTVASDG
jgi:hypothetical protein